MFVFFRAKRFPSRRKIRVKFFILVGQSFLYISRILYHNFAAYFVHPRLTFLPFRSINYLRNGAKFLFTLKKRYRKLLVHYWSPKEKVDFGTQLYFILIHSLLSNGGKEKISNRDSILCFKNFPVLVLLTRKQNNQAFYAIAPTLQKFFPKSWKKLVTRIN